MSWRPLQAQVQKTHHTIYNNYGHNEDFFDNSIDMCITHANTRCYHIQHVTVSRKQQWGKEESIHHLVGSILKLMLEDQLTITTTCKWVQARFGLCSSNQLRDRDIYQLHEENTKTLYSWMQNLSQASSHIATLPCTWWCFHFFVFFLLKKQATIMEYQVIQ